MACFYYLNSEELMQNQLNNTEKAIIPIAAFAANGDIKKLQVSLVNGLASGLTVNEIKELLVQIYAYAGFPRSLNALGTFMGVLKERQEQGIIDLEGKSATPVSADSDSLSVGAENQTKLVGQVVSGPLFEFAPEIDRYLKAHLFGDIFQRDVLTWKQRELATIAVLSNINGVNSQLQSHYFISLNNGLTPEMLNAFVDVLSEHCGEEVSSNAQHVLSDVLKIIKQ